MLTARWLSSIDAESTRPAPVDTSEYVDSPLVLPLPCSLALRQRNCSAWQERYVKEAEVMKSDFESIKVRVLILLKFSLKSEWPQERA